MFKNAAPTDLRFPKRAADHRDGGPSQRSPPPSMYHVNVPKSSLIVATEAVGLRGIRIVRLRSAGVDPASVETVPQRAA